jgi:hypothetical protein
MNTFIPTDHEPGGVKTLLTLSEKERIRQEFKYHLRAEKKGFSSVEDFLTAISGGWRMRSVSGFAYLPPPNSHAKLLNFMSKRICIEIDWFRCIRDGLIGKVEAVEHLGPASGELINPLWVYDFALPYHIHATWDKPYNNCIAGHIVHFIFEVVGGVIPWSHCRKVEYEV